jgi:hypothetical protein
VIRTPFVTIVGLLALFSIVSEGFWWCFKRQPTGEEAAAA